MTELNEGAVAPEAEIAPAAPVPASEPESAEASLDAELSKAYDDNMSSKDDDDDSLEIPRDEHGRFARRNPEELTDGQPSEGDKEGQPIEEGEEQPGEAAAIPPPNSWPPEMKEKWAELPSETREFIAHREQQAHTYITRMGQALKQYEPLNEVFSKHQHTFERYGVDPVSWVNNLSQVQDVLDNNPGHGIAWLADYYAKDAGYGSGAEFLEALTMGVHQPPDPRVQQTQQQLIDLQRREQQWQQWAQQQQQAQQHQQWTQTRQSIDHIAADLPDFDTVLPDIMRLLPGLRQEMPHASHDQLIKAAYEQGIYLNPQTRARMLERQTQERASDRRNDPRRAKAIAATNVRGAQTRASAKTSLDDELSKIYDQNMG